MSKEPSPICFRVPPEERVLLEAVAHHVGDTLSAFVRRSARDVAKTIVDDDGDEVLKSFRETLARRADRGNDQAIWASEQLQAVIEQRALARAGMIPETD